MIRCRQQLHLCFPIKNFLRQIVSLEQRRCLNLNSAKLNSLRNIGIMAHIDAGKTTTTERMLFYAGHIKSMGDVDKGNTVTDYLPIEMERGITVQSAAVSFDWKGTYINLIDTPGHVDFTVEVERSLRVLDGAVAVFDAAKGVQAQSRTVWKQANRHQVPRLAFISKMDKPGASYDLTVLSMKKELESIFLLLQLPLIVSGKFVGNVDVVDMCENLWDEKCDRSGRKFITSPLHTGHQMWEKALQSRADLIEQLADMDDLVAEMWLESDGDVEKFPVKTLKSAIKRATLQESCVPVLCGSSFRNIGVQPLLDAVVDYLPAPQEINHDFLKFYKESFTGMAFKILHDKKLGPIVFTRVYSGIIKTGSSPYNVNKQKSESTVKLLKADANNFIFVDSLKAGEIGIISGLQHTITGDTLVSTEKSFQNASVEASQVGDGKLTAVLSTVPIPEPVFYRTVYANSHSHEKALRVAMEKICREDPSIRVDECEQDGNMILSGMGELHVEVIAERIKKEFKIDAYIGPIRVAYQEQPTEEVRHSGVYERTMFDHHHTVTVGVHIIPTDDDVKINHPDDVIITQPNNPRFDAARRGIVLACRKGNLLGYPVIGARVKLYKLMASKGCPPPIISSSVIKCTREALIKTKCVLKQPMMEIEVCTTDSDISPIVAELSRCHADIDDVTMNGRQQIVRAVAPVEDMKGFSSKLRSATSGRADISMNVSGYDVVPVERFQHIRDVLSGSAS